MPDQSFTEFMTSQAAPVRTPAPAVQSFGDFMGAQQSAQPDSSDVDLPHPDLVDQQTTLHAQTLARILAPPVPAPPLPDALQTDDQVSANAPVWTNQRTGQRAKMLPPGQGGGPLNVLDSPLTGGSRMGEGFEQMAQPGLRQKAGGLHKVIAGGFEAATPLMVGAGAVAPVATAATLAATTGAQAGTEAVLKKIGIPEEYAQVAGDFVGLFAAAKTPRTIEALKAKYEPVLKARFEKAKLPEPTANSVGAETYKPAASGQDAALSGSAGPAAPAGESFDAFMKARAPAAAPVKAAPVPSSPDGGGVTATVRTPAGTKARVRYRIDEAKGLTTSFDGGNYNAEFQPRNTDRLGSRQRVEQRKADMDPEAMGYSRMAGDGAPITSGKMAVTRNHGLQALKEIYSERRPLAESYRGFVSENAGLAGKTPEEVAAMEHPVLHRELNENWDNGQIGKFAEEANASSTARMSDAEIAEQMSRKLTGASMDAFHPNDDGIPNAEFVRGLIKDLPVEEQAMFFDKHGEISQSGARLVRNAVFAKAYPNRAAIERMSEATDSNVRNITNGMLRSANDVAKMQEAIDRGDRHPLSISEDIGKAAGVIDDLRTSKKSVDDWLSQEHFDGRDAVLDQLVRIFANEGRRPKVIANTIQNYVDGIDRAGNPNQDSMFAAEPPTKIELLKEAYDSAKRTAEREADGRRREGPQGSLSVHQSGDGSQGAGPDGRGDSGGTATAGGETRPPADASVGVSAGGAPPAIPPEDRVAGAAGEAPETGPHGPILRNFHHDAAGAIAELGKRQDGEAPGALQHPQVGDIDLIWGKAGAKGYGLAKIAERHPEVLPDLQGVLDRLHETSRNENTIQLDGDGYSAVIRRNWKGDPKTWLLTAFGKAGEEAGPSASRTIDVAGTHATERQAPPPGGSSSSLPEKPPPSADTLDAGTAPPKREGGASVPPGDGSSSSLTGTAKRPAGETEPRDTGPTYMGTGFGALEPLFREAKAEGDRLRAARNAALAAADAAKAKPEEMKAGEKIRAYFTSERDLWAARTNQAIDVVTRKVLPKMQDREALGIAREFRHKRQELQEFIDGTHPFLQEVDGGTAVAEKNLAKLMPVLRNAQRILAKPTARERAADAAFTNIAERDLKEGIAGGWMGSRWLSDEYLPHALNPQGEGEVAKLPSTTGRAMGKIGKYFGFGERRSDRYPTMVHAVADGIIPKTLDPSALFIVHADGFARARATHLLEAHLADSGLGKWTNGSHAPEGTVQLAGHTEEFKKEFAYAEPGSFDPETRQSELKTGTMGLYVRPFIAKALEPITDPDYLDRIPGFAKVRTAQRGLKQAILGLSGFHLLTENVMAATDIGPAAMYRAFREPRESASTLENERDLIASGGNTSIQGSTMDAYRGMRPGTIPTRAEVIRGYVPGTKQALEVADSITRFTFDNVQRRFKIWSFALHRDAWIRDNPGANPEQLAEAKKGIASYVNGTYGGLHWENMGWSRAMVGVSRFFMLAPDWSFSNVALGKYAVDSPLSPKEIPFRARMAGATTKESAQARLSRAFWTKVLLGGMITNQMLSLMHSGKLSPRPFQVNLGKDQNGLDVFQNVVFRGNAGDLVSWGTKMVDHGILVGTGVFAGSKAAPFVKAGIHAITGLDDLGREIAPKEMNWLAKNARSTWSVATDVSPVPIVARSIYRTTMGDQSDKFLWSERILSCSGRPPSMWPRKEPV